MYLEILLFLIKFMFCTLSDYELRQDLTTVRDLFKYVYDIQCMGKNLSYVGLESDHSNTKRNIVHNNNNDILVMYNTIKNLISMIETANDTAKSNLKEFIVDLDKSVQHPDMYMKKIDKKDNFFIKLYITYRTLEDLLEKYSELGYQEAMNTFRNLSDYSIKDYLEHFVHYINAVENAFGAMKPLERIILHMATVNASQLKFSRNVAFEDIRERYKAPYGSDKVSGTCVIS